MVFFHLKEVIREASVVLTEEETTSEGSCNPPQGTDNYTEC